MIIPTFVDRHFSTQKLRAIRDTALELICNLPDKKKTSSLSIVTIHLFKNCCIVFAKFKTSIYSEEYKNYKFDITLAVYTKNTDCVSSWKEYRDQFEPTEGLHKAFEYSPFDSPFPTKKRVNLWMM